MFNGRNVIKLTGTGSVGALFTSAFQESEPGAATISVQTYYVAAGLVRRGAGIAIVDEFTARASLGPEIDFRPLADAPSFEIFCVHLEDRPPSRIGLEFVASVQKAIAASRRQAPVL